MIPCVDRVDQVACLAQRPLPFRVREGGGDGVADDGEGDPRGGAPDPDAQPGDPVRPEDHRGSDRQHAEHRAVGHDAGGHAADLQKGKKAIENMLKTSTVVHEFYGKNRRREKFL